MTYRCIIIQIKPIAETTLFIEVEKPAKYEYQAGQYTYVGVPYKKYPDYDHHQRLLSFMSAPHESTLKFVLRMRDSGYKKELAELKTGDYLEISHAIGDFTFLNSDKPIICLAGGIGIAPFISLLKTKQHHKLNQPITLIWSNQTVATTPFLNEMQNIEKDDSDLNVIYFLTRENKPEPPFANHRISIDWLKQEKYWNSDTQFMLCGPPEFVTNLSDDIMAQGVAGSNLKFESLDGY